MQLSMFPEIVSLRLSVIKISVRVCREEIFRRRIFILDIYIRYLYYTKWMSFGLMCFRNFGLFNTFFKAT